MSGESVRSSAAIRLIVPYSRGGECPPQRRHALYFLSFLGFLVSFLRSMPFAIEKSPFAFDYASGGRILRRSFRPRIPAWQTAAVRHSRGSKSFERHRPECFVLLSDWKEHRPDG
jgi:hypothetical protein